MRDGDGETDAVIERRIKQTEIASVLHTTDFQHSPHAAQTRPGQTLGERR